MVRSEEEERAIVLEFERVRRRGGVPTPTPSFLAASKTRGEKSPMLLELEKEVARLRQQETVLQNRAKKAEETSDHRAKKAEEVADGAIRTAQAALNKEVAFQTERLTSKVGRLESEAAMLHETVEGLQSGLDMSLEAEKRLQNVIGRLQEENQENLSVVNRMQSDNEEKGAIIEKLNKELASPHRDAAVDGLIARLLREAETANEKLSVLSDELLGERMECARLKALLTSLFPY